MSNESWLNAFKLAIIDKDTERMDQLNSCLPNFDTVEHMQEAQAYLKQGMEIILQKQNELRDNMSKIQKTKKFLNS